MHSSVITGASEEENSNRTYKWGFHSKQTGTYEKHVGIIAFYIKSKP